MNPNQTNKKKTSEESKRRVGVGDARDPASVPVPAFAAAERRRRTACAGFEVEVVGVANPGNFMRGITCFCFIGVSWA